jgi:hypothetical protein
MEDGTGALLPIPSTTEENSKLARKKTRTIVPIMETRCGTCALLEKTCIRTQTAESLKAINAR